VLAMAPMKKALFKKQQFRFTADLLTRTETLLQHHGLHYLRISQAPQHSFKELTSIRPSLGKSLSFITAL